MGCLPGASEQAAANHALLAGTSWACPACRPGAPPPLLQGLGGPLLLFSPGALLGGAAGAAAGTPGAPPSTPYHVAGGPSPFDAPGNVGESQEYTEVDISSLFPFGSFLALDMRRHPYVRRLSRPPGKAHDTRCSFCSKIAPGAAARSLAVKCVYAPTDGSGRRRRLRWRCCLRSRC